LADFPQVLFRPNVHYLHSSWRIAILTVYSPTDDPAFILLFGVNLPDPSSILVTGRPHENLWMEIAEQEFLYAPRGFKSVVGRLSHGLGSSHDICRVLRKRGSLKLPVARLAFHILDPDISYNVGFVKNHHFRRDRGFFSDAFS